MAAMRLSILDDFQGVALDMADWSPVRSRGIEIAVERHPFVDEDAVVRALADFRNRRRDARAYAFPEIRCRPPAQAETADYDGHAQRLVRHGGAEGPWRHRMRYGWSRRRQRGHRRTRWGLILGAARHIAEDHQFMRQGGWQTRIGHRVAGKTLGLLGLGRLGSAVARVGLAFGMKAIAWSQNLTADKAAEQGVERVEKDELFRSSDILSVHLVLSPRSRGLVGAREIGLMKPTAILVNTSRGPIVDTSAVIEALKGGRLAYAGFDVYDKEPLPIDHPLRTAPNVILTPHIGYVTDENYRSSYPQIVENVVGFLDGKPVRVI